MTVDNFVGSLVEMAKAHERLPQVEADLAEARHNIQSHLNTIQRLEAKLQDRANEISDLNAKVRSLEVERDDAQFHALEADDRTSRALDFIKATFGNAGTLIQALEPPREPVPAPLDQPKDTHGVTAEPGQREPGEPQASSVSVDTPQSGATEAPSTASGASSVSEVAAPSGEPTASSSSPPSPAPDASTPNVEGATSVSPQSGVEPFSMPPIHRPYAGKRWSDLRNDPDFTVTDRDEWVAGGGTIDNWYA